MVIQSSEWGIKIGLPSACADVWRGVRQRNSESLHFHKEVKPQEVKGQQNLFYFVFQCAYLIQDNRPKEALFHIKNDSFHFRCSQGWQA